MGGVPSGLLVDDGSGTSPIKFCSSSSRSFVLTNSLQHHGGDEGACAGGAPDKNRCDALSFTESYVEVAVSTSGSYGTLMCAAFSAGSSAPVSSLMNLQDPNKKSAFHAGVSEDEIDYDHVVILSDLDSDTQYDIYCHMDETYMSPMLRVWTDVNDRLWGDTLAPSSTTGTPANIVLTFSHGKAFANGDVIILTTNLAIFANASNPICEAWSDGVLHQIPPTASVSNNAISLTLKVDSAAGSELKIDCSSDILANPSSGTIISYTLVGDADKHPVALENRYGWTAT